MQGLIALFAFLVAHHSDFLLVCRAIQVVAVSEVAHGLLAVADGICFKAWKTGLVALGSLADLARLALGVAR